MKRVTPATARFLPAVAVLLALVSIGARVGTDLLAPPAHALTTGSVQTASLPKVNVPDEDLRAFVAGLSDRALQGRGAGSAGLDKAAEMIAARFAEAGLKPAADAGGWFQSFRPVGPRLTDAVRLPAGAKWGEITLKNVVGLLPGTGEGVVVVGAHYDHLGLDAGGNPYPGADDNASGVAALCAIARDLAAEPPHRRGVVFVAFSGEEAGLLGSQWYVEHPVVPLESTIGMINLDTVGRMEEHRLLIFSSSSALEYPATLRGINLQIGLELSIPEKGPIGSDQVSFLSKGVPALHFFTGPNADYHRTSDTADKINYAGLREVVSFAEETVRFLAGRDRNLTFVPPGAGQMKPPASSAAPSAPRRVSLGTIPDMAFEGDGVLVSGVLPGSPAEKAGLQKGDRIVGVDDDKVSGLEDYSGILKSHKPGDVIRVRFVRDDKEQTVEATLVERK
jgi:aminopeptidase N